MEERLCTFSDVKKILSEPMQKDKAFLDALRQELMWKRVTLLEKGVNKIIKADEVVILHLIQGELQFLNFPNTVVLSNGFLKNSQSIRIVRLPMVDRIGNHVLSNVPNLKELYTPNLRFCGDESLRSANLLKFASFPFLEETGVCFLSEAKSLRIFLAPRLEKTGNSSLSYLSSLKIADVRSIKFFAPDFLIGANLKKVFISKNVYNKMVGMHLKHERLLNKLRDV